MKIAVTYQDEMIFQHFGHTEKFKVYTVENGNILDARVVDTNGQGHGALAGFLAQQGVSVLICGGIGGGAQTALTQQGIKFFGGVKGGCDQAVQDYLQGKLDFNPCVKCNHHDHGHGEDGHSCGEHGCH